MLSTMDEETGFGLSLSYAIVVKGHRGNITVESTEGGRLAIVVRCRFKIY